MTTLGPQRYLSMLGLKLIHVSKNGPRSHQISKPSLQLGLLAYFCHIHAQLAALIKTTYILLANEHL